MCFIFFYYSFINMYIIYIYIYTILVITRMYFKRFLNIIAIQVIILKITESNLYLCVCMYKINKYLYFRENTSLQPMLLFPRRDYVPQIYTYNPAEEISLLTNLERVRLHNLQHVLFLIYNMYMHIYMHMYIHMYMYMFVYI